ncbi:MAG: CapA family protein [Deltaproteobacteria bacterium]|nr:CapA family protein [Deltaproteobacteria bacterium]
MRKNYTAWHKSLLYGFAGSFILIFLSIPLYAGEMNPKKEERKKEGESSAVTLFLTGDVMSGRGIDQVLSHPSHPRIYEPYVRDARTYTALAEEVNGPISRPVEWDYIWGIALRELAREKPDVRIINLETALTKSNEYWQGKGINYRMHPENIPLLRVANIDVAVLANNHILDWGYSGLKESLETLGKAGISHAGAGMDLDEAEKPAIVDLGNKGRVLVFSYAMESSGVPSSWAAKEKQSGLSLLNDFSAKTIDEIEKKVKEVREKGDVVVLSLHWGGNWGYPVLKSERTFVHGLVDKGIADIIHGHSSHHIKGIEVYKGKLILYGCGDLINDYEGIGGYEEFRGDLGLMYFATADQATGRLLSLKMKPVMMRNFSLKEVSRKDFNWLKNVLNREGTPLGTRVEEDGDKGLLLKWE